MSHLVPDPKCDLCDARAAMRLPDGRLMCWRHYAEHTRINTSSRFARDIVPFLE